MSACQRNPARASSRDVSPLGVQRGLSQPSGGVPAVAASTSRQRTMSAHSASGVRYGGSMPWLQACAATVWPHPAIAAGSPGYRSATTPEV